jgi:hypothetical protein
MALRQANLHMQRFGNSVSYACLWRSTSWGSVQGASPCSVVTAMLLRVPIQMVLATCVAGCNRTVHGWRPAQIITVVRIYIYMALGSLLQYSRSCACLYMQSAAASTVCWGWWRFDLLTTSGALRAAATLLPAPMVTHLFQALNFHE